MLLVYILFILSAFFELLAVLEPTGNFRKITSSTAIMCLSFSTGGILFSDCNILTALITIVSFYRCINILRVVSSSLDEKYLHRVVWQTTAWLFSAQLILLAINNQHLITVSIAAVWIIFSALVLLFALAQLILTLSHLATTKISWDWRHFADSELPTVTVAIPARNEDAQLEACLQSVIANDYPKLEVIVLDDCSQDNTSQIIRKFAHDGVRFVRGGEPKSHWLAKNQAYERLYKESNGEILLYSGVDVSFQAQTIRQLVASMIHRKMDMMSVMPINTQKGFSLPQSFRYMWELIPPRKKLGGPPVLSTCWLIKKDALKKLGGFDGVANMITPEAYFARQLHKQGNYTFARSDKNLGLETSKSFTEQFDTSLRVRYPQTHRRPEIVAVSSLLELILMVLPFALTIAGVFTIQNDYFYFLIYLGASVVLCVAYANIGFRQFPRGRLKFIFAMPAAVMLDVAILNYSMCKYEFSEVIWKGRNVCLPVMRVVSKLPKV